MSELARHRDALRAELEQVREELAQATHAAGGEAAQRLRDELEPLEAEIATLAAESDRLGDLMVQLEDELEELRRENAGARRHLADLEAERT